MPKRAGSHLPRPRHSRSRAQRPLIQTSAPELPDNLWQLLACILARTSPYDCLKLSMVCRGARASINADDQLWLSILRQKEKEYWESAATRNRFHVLRSSPFHFTSLSEPPDFMRVKQNDFYMLRHFPSNLFHTLPEDAIPAYQ
jgi:hypothetical protein